MESKTLHRLGFIFNDGCVGSWDIQWVLVWELLLLGIDSEAFEKATPLWKSSACQHEMYNTLSQNSKFYTYIISMQIKNNDKNLHKELTSSPATTLSQTPSLAIADPA